MPYLERPDGDLLYDAVGDGPPLVLASGLGGSHTFWQNIVPRLASEYRVILHDHMGTGLTRSRRTEHTVEALAADVVALLDHLGIARAHLVGHSTGAALGQVLAANAPDRLDRLVLFAGWAGPDPHFALCFEMRMALLLGSGIPAYHRGAPLFLYPPRWIAADPARLDAITDGMIALSPPVETLVARMDMITRFDRRPDAARIRAPTLVVCAEDDILTPLYLSEELADLIPGARLARLPWGGHSASQTDPDAFLAAVRPFLAGEQQQGA